MNSIKASIIKARPRISKLFVLPYKPASFVHTGSAVEEPDYYKPGGFHPVTLGDTFRQDQYTILRKLGYGQYSTVWLARDSKYVVYRYCTQT